MTRKFGLALISILASVSVGHAEVRTPGGTTVRWRPGISSGELASARVVQIPHGVRSADLKGLRPDQVIETPSGNHLTVARLRKVQDLIATAVERHRTRRSGDFAILPRSSGPVQTLRPGETYRDALNRPPSDVVRLPSGRSISVAQLRLMADSLERRRRLELRGPMPAPGGRLVLVKSASDITSLPRNTPDSTVLQMPSGQRVTLGALKAAVKAAHDQRLRVPTSSGVR